MIRFILVAILFFSSDIHAQETVENPADRILTVDQILRDVDLLDEAYSRIHPGYTRYAVSDDITAAWNSIRTQAQNNGGLSLGQFYLAVQRALTVIRCDHTKAEIPKVLREFRKETPTYLPFKWQIVAGRGFVTGVPADSAVKINDEILSIDGRALPEVIAEVAPLIPVDGYTTWARSSGIAQSLEFMGGAVDHFGALMWRLSPQASVVVRRKESGSEETVTLERATWDDYRNIEELDEPAVNFKDSVTYRAVGDDAAYLRVDTFVNYRNPVKPHKVFDPVFKKLREEERKTLILDLRRNGGGSDDAQNELMKNLITKEMRLVRDARAMTIDHSGLEEYLTTWEKRAINPPGLAFNKNSDGTYSLKPFFESVLKAKKPARYAFGGNLIVLTSRANSSGSTNMIAVLKSLDRATLIGERTGGSPNGTTAGVILALALPNSGIRARIPQFRYFNNVEGFKEGYGAKPDIAAPLTAEAFLAGRDPAMEAALALIDGR